MAKGFLTFKTIYLLPRIESPAAVEDARAPGWFRHEDVMVASDERAVIGDIRQRGGVPVDVRPYKNTGDGLAALFGSHVSRDYKIQFLQAINFHLLAGESPGRALRSVIESETGPLRRRLNLAGEVLEKGGAFADAIEAPGFFDETTVAILEAGERSGSLRDALASAIHYQNSRQHASKIMFGAVTWTALDLFFAVTAIIGNRFFFLPGLKKQGLKAEDPEEIEQFNKALDLAFLINDVLLVLTIVLVAGISWGIVLYSNPQTRPKVDAWIQRVPVLKDVMVNLAVSSTLRIASALLKGGVSFLSACDISSRGTRMAPVVGFWHGIAKRIETGEAVQRALMQPLLDVSERMIVAAHNSQQQLGEIFGMIADRRNEQATSAAKRFAIIAFVASLAYSSASVLSSLYVGYLQNKTVMSAPV